MNEIKVFANQGFIGALLVEPIKFPIVTPTTPFPFSPEPKGVDFHAEIMFKSLAKTESVRQLKLDERPTTTEFENVTVFPVSICVINPGPSTYGKIPTLLSTSTLESKITLGGF